MRARSLRRALLAAALGLAYAGGAAATDGHAPLPAWRGGELPELRLVDRAGTPRTLAELAGQVLVVNLWATWCIPCRQEMPSLERLAQRYRGKPLQVIAISAGDTPEQVEEFLARTPVALTILVSPGRAVLKAWRVRALPSTFVFDRAGRVRYAFVGERDWSDPAVTDALDAMLDGR